LNKIYKSDSFFTNIICQQHTSDSKWEIYLEEEEKGLIALSESGSSHKTILLVLINIILLPKKNNKKNISDYIFAFEELENNLHPSLLRRLLSYLIDTHNQTRMEICK
jgi:hypothetical protein